MSRLLFVTVLFVKFGCRSVAGTRTEYPSGRNQAPINVLDRRKRHFVPFDEWENPQIHDNKFVQIIFYRKT